LEMGGTGHEPKQLIWNGTK